MDERIGLCYTNLILCEYGECWTCVRIWYGVGRGLDQALE